MRIGIGSLTLPRVLCLSPARERSGKMVPTKLLQPLARLPKTRFSPSVLAPVAQG